MKTLIKKVVETFGPSGREDSIREIIKKEIEPFVDSLAVDTMGNLHAVKKGAGARVMVAAHMDEIGFVVTHIDKMGFLRISPVGGVAPVRCLYQRVLLDNGVKGVIGVEPVKNNNEIDFSKLYVDIGAKDEDEARSLAGEGRFGAFLNEMTELNDLIAAKSLDDRIGCVVAIEAARRLKKSPNEIHFVFTVQEEVGLRGARAAAFRIEPELGIALDVTGTGDTPESAKMPMKLRNGVAIKIKDSSLLVPKKVKEFFMAVAERNKIRHQPEILTFGGTDAGAINLSKSGILAGCLSIPTRYIHSVSETASLSDIEETVKLLVKILECDVKKELALE
ncbi:MAG TPA: M42 family peptidase [Firmicutes bacterium]|nr:M42 family peptidase [Bacillota bacterium]